MNSAHEPRPLTDALWGVLWAIEAECGRDVRKSVETLMEEHDGASVREAAAFQTGYRHALWCQAVGALVAYHLALDERGWWVGAGDIGYDLWASLPSISAAALRALADMGDKQAMRILEEGV